MNIQFHYFGNCQLDLYDLKKLKKKNIYATVKASLLSFEKEDIIAKKNMYLHLYLFVGYTHV